MLYSTQCGQCGGFALGNINCKHLVHLGEPYSKLAVVWCSRACQRSDVASPQFKPTRNVSRCYWWCVRGSYCQNCITSRHGNELHSIEGRCNCRHQDSRVVCGKTVVSTVAAEALCYHAMLSQVQVVYISLASGLT